MESHPKHTEFVKDLKSKENKKPKDWFTSRSDDFYKFGKFE